MDEKVLQLCEEKLNLPSFDFRIRKEANGKPYIFDPLRRKFLLLTPEEWVRVHLVHYLTTYLNYPRSLISLERGLTYNSLSKRYDVLVRDRTGNAFFLIECKAPEVSLTQKTVEQVSIYNQKIQAAFLGISNGNRHICMQRDIHSGNYVQIDFFPEFLG
ncbi:type I restriction enzyme HsdR N-terminal domain-containing protein [Cyclobacterium jeungdonense]|uniref:Type I restriction enzyme HsdR N-terminal domain-containing protein n=1 Tax=Cyclobacterium jeungdonense TaxID=708087 RepID=A0ABT8C2K1_9BACT|nr:type I restriction enzyme HsdR N-terminal domain-containing protein [Cyclobacterium jeungdonense]MDN3686966.1 type I restriction enzyme HsdR N-terminal domain-containing protein [Cyclobacterium jeungdonense]